MGHNVHQNVNNEQIKVFLNGQTPASFCLFLFFSHDDSTNTINDKSIDGVLGTRTQGGRIVDTDESTELLRHPAANKSLKMPIFN